MNSDEILQIIGKSNFAIGLGGYNYDDFDDDCEIYNLLIFDGNNKSDE